METATADHFTVTTYLGTRHYGNDGRVFVTRELAESHARKCEGGSGRSGSSASAAIAPCDCAEWAGQE